MEPSRIVTAAIMTAAFKVGNYWQCNDYYFKSKSQFRWGFFEDKELTKPVGPFKLYFKKGQLAERGYYKNRKKSGKWEWFDIDGNLIKTTTYQNGISIGHGFSVEGKDTIFSYLDSLGRGYYFQKFANGTIVLQGKCIDDNVQDSIWTYYDDAGRKWFTKRFVRGKIVQEISYDTLGNITVDTAIKEAAFKQKGHKDTEVQNYLLRHILFPYNLRLNSRSLLSHFNF